MSEKSVVILGSTSGVGSRIAMECARDGYDVLLAARDSEQNELIATDIRTRFDAVKVMTLDFDAVDYGGHQGFFERCEAELGDLAGGVIVCFGYMVDQELTENDFSETRKTIDINYTGTVSIVNIFANAFEERKSGFIGIISSVAGDRGRAKNYTYGSAKAAVTAYASGLRNRLFKSGVSVTTIKPGFMDTKMTHGMDLPKSLTASPEQAGKAIWAAVRNKQDVAYVLAPWEIIMWIIRSIPEWLFKKMKI